MESDWHAHPVDFLNGIFESYGNQSTCKISEAGWEELVSALTIAEYSDSEVTDDDAHEHSVAAHLLISFWETNDVITMDTDHDDSTIVPYNVSYNVSIFK